MEHKITYYPTHRLVKGEDLNHHGTLFAGRCAEWFVEAGFVAAASLLPAHNLVCVKIHGMTFQKPVKAGQTICFKSAIVLTGRTSLTVYIRMDHAQGNGLVVDGFVTFIYVDENTRPYAHGITMIPTTEEDRELIKRAEGLPKHTH